MASVAFKEINELLDGALLAVEDYKALMADGKIDFRDIGLLIKISGQLAAFNAAVQGLNNLTLASLSQMSGDEIEQIVAKAMALFGQTAQAVFKK